MVPSTRAEHDDRGRVDRRQFLAGAGSVVAESVVAGTGLVADPFGTARVSAATGPGSYFALPAQRRIADTRNPTVYPFVRLSDRRIRVGIIGVPGVPTSATAAVLTVTVVNRSGYNVVTVYPAGAGVPEASNLNTAVHDEVAATLVTVQLGVDGAVELDAFDACDLVVDLAGVNVPAPTGFARGGASWRCRARFA